MDPEDTLVLECHLRDTEDGGDENFSIGGPSVVIGRSSDCDVVIPLPHASAVHGELVRDATGNSYVYSDQSTNGTVVNGTYIMRRGDSKALNENDCLSVPGNTSTADKQFTIQLKRKRPVDVGGSEAPDIKRIASTETVGTEEFSIAADVYEVCGDAGTDAAAAMGDRPEQALNCGFDDLSPETEKGLNAMMDDFELANDAAVLDSLAEDSPAAPLAPDVPTTRVGVVDVGAQTDAITTPPDVSEEPVSSCRDIVLAGTTTVSPATNSGERRERFTAMEEHVTCSICQSILFECVSPPCMHCFCAACLSSWLSGQFNRPCPDCRCNLTWDSVRPNPVVRSMVESLLMRNPSLEKRTPEELAEMRRMNLFKSRPPSPSLMPVPMPIMVHVPPGTIPQSVSSLFTAVDYYNHLRRLAVAWNSPPPRPSSTPSTAPRSSRCEVCMVDFYCPCIQPECRSTLGTLRNVWLPNDIHERWVNGNPFESGRLLEDMRKLGITVKEVKKQVLDLLDSGDFPIRDSTNDYPVIQGLPRNANINSHSTLVCNKCAQRVFKRLVYIFRARMLEPGGISADTRERCFHGWECWTQFCRILHSERFCHVGKKTARR